MENPFELIRNGEHGKYRIKLRQLHDLKAMYDLPDLYLTDTFFRISYFHIN